MASSDLHALLKRTFGYDTFRPLQLEIIEASLAGKDVFALLPTGGGKSLCYQLPALKREGLTLVVSPLIALMKDQVDGLTAAGIPATYLNSTLDEAEARRRLRGLHEAAFKLLYVAPERLLLEGWAENLKGWNVTAVAIDEAHCVSEWGHDFRPEYRQLAALRSVLPQAPFMAVTATATARVRSEVIRHLALRDPAQFAASFNRPNLTYRVLPKARPVHQIAEFVSRREGESGIVYCATRAATEEVAHALTSRGFGALPYHAGLEPAARSRCHEAFLRDDVRIVCATIAFGMGVNKPNVRWIVHHDLPKNIEGYYQETGRAGRDGLPAECLLLYSGGDAVKQRHFIDQLTSENEQAVARSQLRQMLNFAESAGCRRRELLGYFGETFAIETCGACDNCLEPRESYDGTVDAQMFLSCVYRIRRASGFNVGLTHVAEVLTGADTEKVRRWGHDQLSTFGIGRGRSRSDWIATGRELVQLGLLAIPPGQFAVVDLADEGRAALTERRPVRLTKPLPAPKVRKGAPAVSPDGPYDEALFERLRTLRRRLADERSVPAYVIFGDTTLREMARRRPVAAEDMRGITGVGEKKFADFAAVFAAEIAGYLSSVPAGRELKSY